MKKLFAVFFVVLFALCINGVEKQKSFSHLLNSSNIKSVLVYSNSKLNRTDNSFKKNTQNTQSASFLLNNGINNIYYVPRCNIKNISFKELDFHGVEFVFNKNVNIKKILFFLQANIVKQENIDGRCLIYAYSNFYDKSVTASGVKINFQICVGYDFVKLGYPLLLGGY